MALVGKASEFYDRADRYGRPGLRQQSCRAGADAWANDPLSFALAIHAKSWFGDDSRGDRQSRWKASHLSLAERFRSAESCAADVV